MFGNVTAIREETRDMWTLGSLDTLLQDMRFGARLLRRSPAFTIAAVASLAIGIGAAAAVFSLADGMLFRKLRGAGAARNWSSSGGSPGRRSPLESLNGYGTQSETESSSTSFSLKRLRGDPRPSLPPTSTCSRSRTCIAPASRSTASPTRSTRRRCRATTSTCSASRRPPAGCSTTADDRPGAPAAAVIGFDLWQRRFGGDAGAVGN